MGSSDPFLSAMRMPDILTLFEVRRAGSITGAARELAVTPSQVSKAIARLERHFGVRFVSRGVHGVTLTEAGQRVIVQLEDVMARLQRIRRSDTDDALELTVAAPPYLNKLFLPVLATCAPHLRVRGLEVAPALVRAYAVENVFDLALTLGPESLPPSWVATRIGDVRKGLFGSPPLAKRLGPQPVLPERLRAIPFICPIYSFKGQLISTNDDECPLTYAGRKFGHGAETLGLALELAVTTEQLVFGPVIAGRPYVERGTLVEIQVEGWDVRKPLYAIFNGDKVLARVQRAVIKALKTTLSRMSVPFSSGVC